jgi:hypothetical protein
VCFLIQRIVFLVFARKKLRTNFHQNLVSKRRDKE